MLTKEQATERGTALLRLIKYKGFHLRVWENLGWHYSCDNGHIRVDGESYGLAQTPDRFLVSPVPEYAHYGLGRSRARDRDPNVGIRRVLRGMRAYLSREIDTVQALEVSLSRKK